MQQWLKERRVEIEERLHHLRARAVRIEAHHAREAAGDVSDLVDRAQLHENDEVVEALATRVDADLPALEAALARIDDGTYGTCAECGSTIARPRLDLLPATPFCATCASERPAM